MAKKNDKKMMDKNQLESILFATFYVRLIPMETEYVTANKPN